MSWLFSRALVEEYSAGACSAGELSAQWSETPMPQEFLSRAKTTEPLNRSLCGQMLAPSTEHLGAALLTWFQAASRARISALRAKEQASTASVVDSGATWRGSLARFDPASHSWRTAQRSLIEDSDECSVTWPRSGMTAGGQCWELPTLAPPISAIGSGLWVPTPCAADTGAWFNPSDSPNAALRPTLGAMAKHSLWPTPTATLGTNGGRVTPRKSKEGVNLIEAVANRARWPTPHGFSPDGRSNGPSGNELVRAVNQSLRVATPTARDWRSGKASEATHAKNSRPLSEQIGGSLNPTWVEWLMGWPIGWSDLKPLGTDRCRCVPQAHGGF